MIWIHYYGYFALTEIDLQMYQPILQKMQKLFVCSPRSAQTAAMQWLLATLLAAVVGLSGASGVQRTADKRQQLVPDQTATKLAGTQPSFVEERGPAWSCCRICPDQFFPELDQRFGETADDPQPIPTAPAMTQSPPMLLELAAERAERTATRAHAESKVATRASKAETVQKWPSLSGVLGSVAKEALTTESLGTSSTSTLTGAAAADAADVSLWNCCNVCPGYAFKTASFSSTGAANGESGQSLLEKQFNLETFLPPCCKCVAVCFESTSSRFGLRSVSAMKSSSRRSRSRKLLTCRMRSTLRLRNSNSSSRKQRSNSGRCRPSRV